MKFKFEVAVDVPFDDPGAFALAQEFIRAGCDALASEMKTAYGKSPTLDSVRLMASPTPDLE